jgi:hypothetical protein
VNGVPLHGFYNGWIVCETSSDAGEVTEKYNGMSIPTGERLSLWHSSRRGLPREADNPNWEWVKVKIHRQTTRQTEWVGFKCLTAAYKQRVSTPSFE